jgi:hypothetical protein
MKPSLFENFIQFYLICLIFIDAYNLLNLVCAATRAAFTGGKKAIGPGL